MFDPILCQTKFHIFMFSGAYCIFGKSVQDLRAKPYMCKQKKLDYIYIYIYIYAVVLLSGPSLAF